MKKSLISTAILLVGLILAACAPATPAETQATKVHAAPPPKPLALETTPTSEAATQDPAGSTPTAIDAPQGQTLTPNLASASKPTYPSTRSATSTLTPVAPTRENQSSQPETPEPETASPIILWPEPTWLTGMIDSLPLSVATTGVWLSNPDEALEFAGLEPAKSAEEWIARTPEQHEEHQKALEGILYTGLQNTMREFYADWENTFGFGAWDSQAMAETGEMEWAGFETNLLTGRFDPDWVKEKLLNLGYEIRTHAGQEYLAVPEGTRPDIEPPLKHLVNPNVRNVFTDGGTLLTAPDTEKLEELLSVRAGETPSLAQHRAFGDLVFTLPDPIFMAVLSRKAVLEPENPRHRQYETRADWGNIGEWKALSAAFSRPSPDTKKMTVSLWYQGLSEAQGAAEDLAQRFHTFHPPEPNPMVSLQAMCIDHWKTEAQESPRGAVLTISCQLESGPSSQRLGTLMLNILVEGTLSFLVS